MQNNLLVFFELSPINYVPDPVDLLAVESELEKELDFNEIIETFANNKARKAAVGTPFN